MTSWNWNSKSNEEEHGPAGLPSAFHGYLDRLEQEGAEAAASFRAQLDPTLRVALDERLAILDRNLLLVPQSDTRVGQQLGPYVLEQVLGEGGMGRVYLARQTDPVDRRVALKVIHPWFASDIRGRFLRERRTMASLDHDGIARLFEAGETAAGELYFAMEYVEGLRIDAYCSKHRLKIESRIGLVVQMCRALEHAHQRGVVHRDLKPDNVLVGGSPEQPRAKVIDFGLAQVTKADSDGHSRFTRPGVFLGTPGYASPEQAAGLDAVDTRTDVYGVGAVLYRLLTGEVPVHVPVGADPASVIGHVEPLRPSSVLARHVERADEFARVAGFTGHEHLAERLRGDLDAIVLCAIEKDRERRYATVGALAADLQSHLADLPVTARQQTRAYLLSKFVRRHFGTIAICVSIAVLIVLSGAVATTSALAASNRLADFNLFGLVRRLRTLDENELYDTIPYGPQAASRLSHWIRDVEAVLAHRSDIERRRANLDALREDNEASGWLDGSGAKIELRRNIDEMLARCDAMQGPSGTLTLARARLRWLDTTHRTNEELTMLWTRASEGLAADPRFAGFALRPQPGLQPLGPDPVTGLQEFAWLGPGLELPQRLNGRFAISSNTCPIFVLLPGGRCWVGSQAEDPQAPNYDRQRTALERNLVSVSVQPFLLAKFEMTQGQWQALTGCAPDEMDLAGVDDPGVLPVTRFDDNELLYAMVAWGIRRPTEDEWEYAARAGVSWRWWTGEDPNSLQGFVNVADQSLVAIGTDDDDSAVSWSDGFAGPAPVDSLEPNPWGFWHIIGNVNELCVAGRADGGTATEGRGGSWHQGWRRCRVSSSFNWEGERKTSIGFRPAMTIAREN